MRSPTIPPHRITRSILRRAVALTAAFLTTTAVAQPCGVTAAPSASPCASGCGALVAQLGQYCVDGRANESGAPTSTNASFAASCAINLNGTGFHRSHALHFDVQGSFEFTHVCIGLNGAAFAAAATPLGSVSVQLFSGPSTSLPDAGVPMGTFSSTWTISGNRILVPVGTITATSGFWVVVGYNHAHPQIHRQLVAPRSGGRAMLRLSGTGVASGCMPSPGAWMDYDSVAGLTGGYVFCGAAPVIRPLRLASSPTGTAAIVAAPAGGLITSESGLTATLTLRLSEPPASSSAVTVRVTTNDAGEGRLLQGGVPVNSLLVGPFTSSSYSFPRNVTVVGVGDNLLDGDQAYTLRVEYESGDPQYAAALTTVAAVNRDQDDPSLAPTRRWTSLATSAAPAARRLYAMAYDEARDELVLFGGRDAFGQTYGDTWVYRANQWQQRVVFGPSARYSSTMVYDTARQVIVLFGGHAPGGGPSHNDTWAWDGTAWTPHVPVAGTPGPRGDHAMAYDASRARVVLYGGRNTPVGAVYQDTYELTTTPDGAGGYDYAWLLRGTGAPGQRTGHGMAYDADLRVSVLFGGYFGGGQIGGTYTWNGAVWSLAATTGPAERTLHAMAFDPIRRRAVIHGGFDGGTMYSDTWEWDGAAWTLLAAASGPQRAMHRMATGGGQLMFGGIDAGNVDHDDVWSLDAASFVRCYHVQGAGTATPFQIGVQGQGWSSVSASLVVPSGTPAAGIASIISAGVAGLPGVVSATPMPSAPHVVCVSFIGGPVAVLSGLSAVTMTSAIVQGSPPVVINPTIAEVFLSGVDCDANGMDDTIDLLDTPERDVDSNGVLDVCETQPCPADLDGDGFVGFPEVLSVLSGWGPCDDDACTGDVDGDLVVGFEDLLAILSAWGPCGPDGEGDV